MIDILWVMGVFDAECITGDATILNANLIKNSKLFHKSCCVNFCNICDAYFVIDGYLDFEWCNNIGWCFGTKWTVYDVTIIDNWYYLKNLMSHHSPVYFKQQYLLILIFQSHFVQFSIKYISIVVLFYYVNGIILLMN